MNTERRDELSRLIQSLYRPFLSAKPEVRFMELLMDRYSVGETRLMTTMQLEDLVDYMQSELKTGVA